MSGLRRGWILAASALACARGGPPQPPTRTGAYGQLHLVSRAGVTPGRPSDPSHGDRRLRDVTLVDAEHPGVHSYRSLHESMHGTIFLFPSLCFTVLAGPGECAWRSVPAGSWRLRSWCARLPRATREVLVVAGQTGDARLSIDGTAP